MELGLNGQRSAFCPLSVEDPARALAKAVETVLRVTLKGPEDFSLPLFIGRILIPEQGQSEDEEQLGLNAIDPLAQLYKSLIRTIGSGSWSPRTFTATDQSLIMWQLVEQFTTHGVAKGDLPASVNRDRTYLPGKEVGAALVEMTEVINGPDFELQPIVAKDGNLALFNTFYPRQGSDKSADVRFVIGREPSTGTGFLYAPGGDEIVNRWVAIGAPLNAEEESPIVTFPAYVAHHLDSIAQFGIWERLVQLEDVTEVSTLKAHAEGLVAATAYPVPYFDFTAALEQAEGQDADEDGVPPRFGIDYWIGDTIGVDYWAPGATEALGLSGRITDAVVTETESGGIEVKLTCAPEVKSAGVTGEALALKIPEAAE